MGRIVFLAFGLIFSAIMIAAISRTALAILKFYIERAHPHARLRLWLSFIGGASGFDWCDNCQSFHPREVTIEELKKLPRRDDYTPHIGPHLDPERDVRRTGPHRPTDPEAEIIAASFAGLIESVTPEQLTTISSALRTDQMVALTNLILAVRDRKFGS